MAIDIELLRDASAVIMARRDELHERFHRLLGERHPALEQSLDEDERNSTRRIFDGGLQALLAYSNDPDRLEQAVRGIASDQVINSFDPEYLEVFGSVCLEALAELFGERWSKQMETAFDDAICLVAAIIQRTLLDYRSLPKPTRAAMDTLP